MTIYEDTNSKPLLDLLDRIHSGDMVLPDFQRDFVWEPSATQALIVSIANNYPAGSILRVRDRQRQRVVLQSRIAERPFGDVPFARRHGISRDQRRRLGPGCCGGLSKPQVLRVLRRRAIATIGHHG